MMPTTVAWLYLYGFLAVAFSTIAHRTGSSGAWMAFVPPFQPWLLVRLSGRSLPWVLALLVPGLNVAVLALMLGDVAARRRLPRLLGVVTVAAPCLAVAWWMQTEQPALVPGLAASIASLCVYAGLVAYAR